MATLHSQGQDSSLTFKKLTNLNRKKLNLNFTDRILNADSARLDYRGPFANHLSDLKDRHIFLGNMKKLKAKKNSHDAEKIHEVKKTRV